MKNTLTAHFDSRDMADLALMRLRRGGVDFSVSRLTIEGPQRDAYGTQGYAAMYSPYSANMSEPLGSSEASFRNLGSRAALWQVTPPERGDAVLSLSLEQEQIKRAREILRSAHGREISVR